jgi:hypothetical protein
MVSSHVVRAWATPLGLTHYLPVNNLVGRLLDDVNNSESCYIMIGLEMKYFRWRDRPKGMS